MSPVFIVGCGRSGTSYLRTIIDAHPEFFVPSESLFLVDYLKWGALLPKRILSWLFFHEPQLLCWYERGPFEFDSIQEAIRRVHEVEAQAHGARWWGQKTPRFINHMQLLEEAFPGARWILIYRDPRGVAASMKASKQHTYSIAKACQRWKRDNRPVMKFLKEGLPNTRVMLIRFEDLVLDYEPTLGALFDFLGVKPITGDEVNARGRPVFFKRSRFAINTIRGNLTPDPAVIDNWRKCLRPAEIAYIEGACSEEMEVMGYRLSAERQTADTIGLQALKDAGILLQYLRNWPEYLLMTSLRKALMGLFSIPSRLAKLFSYSQGSRE
jgi:hypothetical protein